MEKQEKVSNAYYTVDILHIIKSLWKRAWIIIASGIFTAIIGFIIAAIVIAPTYSSSIMLYVNNSSFSLGNTNFSISSSEITAAQSLVKTYGVILNNRTTLERVIEKAEVSYNYKELGGMISSAQANDTEIMRVTVTTEDPYEAAKIANTIAEVLPIRIAEIIDGASMEVVDSAIPVLEKVAPSISEYTAVGLILGAVIAAAIIVVITMMDDTIQDEEYVIQAYNYPILAKIPDLVNSGNKPYGYYYQRSNKKAN